MDDKTPYWWIDHASTIASVPLALLGFAITIWQLVKTRNSADAAAASVEAMQQQIRRVNLASLLPQLHRIEEELDRAVAEKSVESIRIWIGVWRWQAGELRAYLSMNAPSEKKLLRSIQASISTAADTKDEMHRVTDMGAIPTVTVSLRKSVSRVTGDLGTLAAQQVIESGGAPTNA